MSYSGLVYTGEPQTGVVAASGLFEVAGDEATGADDYVATASLKDKGDYAWVDAGSSDDVQVPWSIARADMGEASISRIAAQAWTGSQLAPKPVVAFNGDRLVEGEDYAVSYGANVEPGVGAGSVTVSAAEAGNFTGSVTVFFDIEKRITFPDVDYDNDWFAPAGTFASSRGSSQVTPTRESSARSTRSPAGSWPRSSGETPAPTRRPPTTRPRP